MQTYLLIAWPAQVDDANAQATAWSAALWRSAHWVPALRRPGLEVWTARGIRLPVREMGPHGAVVIGDVFDRRNAAPLGPAGLPGLSDDPLRAARRLATDAWGTYVAALRHADGVTLSAFRDPAGGLEALTWRKDHVVVLSDDVSELPPGFLPGNLSLDWDVITEIVRRPLATAHLCPLAGLRTVAPGDLQPLGEDSRSTTAVWRPSACAARPDDQEPGALRAAVLDGVSALASQEPRLLLEVSGGLDSAIVAAALHATGHAHRIAAALNYFPPQREGDERRYARAVCAAAELPLAEVPGFADEISEADLSELKLTASPAFAGIDPGRDRDTAQRARETGATALFGGQGGDAVFFQMPTAAVVADLLAARGASAVFDPFVADTARWLRCSVWSVLADALRKPPSRIGEPPGSRIFWGPRARTAPALALHPWLQGLDDTPRAKRLQIQALTVGLSAWNRSRRGRVARLVQPLLAQPVLERWLPIPAWRLVEGGRDRALARRLFADLLPAEISARRSKGAMAGAYTRGTAASLPFLREHLLDGVLAEAGVLDRHAMDAALQPDQLIWRNAGVRLSRAAIVESWVRHWQGRAPDRPGADRRPR